MKKKLTVALAGNPNAGKTTIFNNLTGTRQHVGNYPGVTVEKKEGKAYHGEVEINVIDLPGTYSLTSYSPEEVIARKVLLEEEIDVVIHVVDASNAERNLNLTAQLKELGLPLVIALNMMDMANAQGISYDCQLLAQLLGVPVIPVIGTKNQGTRELLEAAVSTAEGRSGLTEKPMRYPGTIEEQISLIQSVLPPDLGMAQAKGERKEFLRRWLAIKLLEHDRDALHSVKTMAGYEDVMRQVEKSRQVLLQY
ncbi:MAG: 50S ribosome-binding GTPase, partial [Syntrophothermus sp.]|uniref:FeoB small GTPase domain-containing protein n=1 Tax=Syntrophothermus sp. TaxID=2736299 RepID=UPI00257F3F53